ncbi:MAG: DedA family protein [Chloroflexi bacterium]|jgi:membrane protein YqaA with SNARE-associated domain|nr:DedA family protein [Chloroflexota bacterium]
MPESSQSDRPNELDSTPAIGDGADVDRIQLEGFQLWLSKNREYALRLAMIAFVVTFVTVGVVMWATDSLNAENAGYGGLWIINFIAAGLIILPISGPAAVCIAAAPDFGLNPLAIGLISASAEALGELTGYMLGLSGRSFFEKNRFYPRVHSWVSKRGGIILFFGAVIPNPLFDVIGVAAGSIGYPIKRFVVIVFVAKSIKSVSVAYACVWGIDWIMGLFV